MKDFIEMINKSNNIVFFGGAGVSVASGIPDFRSADGIFSLNRSISPEEILSHGFFYEHPEEFYDFYKNHMIYQDAKPNKAHEVLAKLEKTGKLGAVITQNIDGLHQAAGSKKVYELHGSVKNNSCTKCGKSYSLDYIMSSPGVPLCSCGAIIKPDVVLYGEQLDTYTLEMSSAYATAADMLIVGGTSLNVYPAASLVNNYLGSRLVIINKTLTPRDMSADIVIHGKIEEVFAEVEKELGI